MSRAVRRAPSMAGVGRIGPWLLAGVLMVWAVSRAGAPLDDILRYAAYFAIGVVLPGLLLLRALAPGRRTWAEEVGLGAVVGLGYELVGWALCTAIGVSRLQIAWALAMPAVFLALPRLRRHWRTAGGPRLPVLWNVSLAGVAVAAVGYWYGASVARTVVPPRGHAYYTDLLWHLALVQETMRSVPPQIPQVAGETMRYHWFADAHLATAVSASGLDPRIVVFRLWFAPLLIAMVLAVAALARQVSRVWWTGPLAAAASVVTSSVALWNHTSVVAVRPVAFFSPSQTYGSVLSVGLAALLVGVLFQRAPGRSWLLVALLTIASAGAKPTTIPLLLGGAGLAALFLLIRDRRLARPVVTAGVGLIVVLVAATVTVSGSTAGTTVRLLGAVRLMPGYAIVTGDRAYPAPGGGVLPEGLRDASSQVVQWAVVNLLAMLLSMALCVLPLVALTYRRTRANPVYWWLAGTVLAGWIGFLGFDHPGGSEYYFLGSAVPFGAVATAGLAASGLAGRPRRLRRTVLVSGMIAAVAVVGVVRFFGNATDPPSARDAGGITDAIARPVVWVAVTAVVAAAAWFVLRVRRPALRGLGVTLVAVLVLGMVLTSRSPGAWRAALIQREPKPVEPAQAPVEDAENDAADWVEHNVPERDVVATNTLCVLPRKPGQCDARGYLISGIGGRRTFIEGWAYTQQSMANQQAGVRYTELPSPWPDRVALTHRAIARPSAAVLGELTARGVRWLVVDGRFSHPDSVRLGRLADRRFDNGLVQIYRLR